jgi:hypothetical protein
MDANRQHGRDTEGQQIYLIFLFLFAYIYIYIHFLCLCFFSSFGLTRTTVLSECAGYVKCVKQVMCEGIDCIKFPGRTHSDDDDDDDDGDGSRNKYGTGTTDVVLTAKINLCENWLNYFNCAIFILTSSFQS